ncbi:type IV toxin-antitoxin system AbiEi family antitoxin domain-containing protein [Streptomyces sp. NBC_01788]|uniref:type IV toxin-antitoxin system AbiEi family antitoxin domain-containing protein n=1 Tax=Streptomyces sp. NBC_01788 TaxID=2975940 RepID=UPI002DDC84A9|nr:type IV toxin-antitoxin system AbiEi family antitoxin domain-containing protein [Streptomyces sp. NBC_01788]WSB28477.1 type IV toxin-antitoxin system AbiEi family antitoxin domain-containing protein [Streptomyces sp. NBC_01788]
MTISSELLRRVRATASQQDWVLTTSQLKSAGADRNTVRRMIRSGQWVPLTRGSYWVGWDDRGPSLRSRVRGTLLTCGPQVVAAGTTAARLLGIEGLPKDDGTLHLAAPPGHEIRSRPGIRVHRSATPPSARMTLRGIPLTNPARTCADLLLQLPRVEAVSVLDSALHKGLLSEPDLLTIPAHLSGRPHAPRARAWLRLADARAESPLETRVRLICLDDGLPPPVLQWRIPDLEHNRSYRIDLGWPTHLVGIETDGKAPHSTPQALYQDRFRQNRLVTLLPNLTLLRFTWADTHHPPSILLPLRQALGCP